jgi:hypothetical protein
MHRRSVTSSAALAGILARDAKAFTASVTTRTPPAQKGSTIDDPLLASRLPLRRSIPSEVLCVEQA